MVNFSANYNLSRCSRQFIKTVECSLITNVGIHEDYLHTIFTPLFTRRYTAAFIFKKKRTKWRKTLGNFSLICWHPILQGRTQRLDVSRVVNLLIVFWKQCACQIVEISDSMELISICLVKLDYYRELNWIEVSSIFYCLSFYYCLLFFIFLDGNFFNLKIHFVILEKKSASVEFLLLTWIFEIFNEINRTKYILQAKKKSLCIFQAIRRNVRSVLQGKWFKSIFQFYYQQIVP